MIKPFGCGIRAGRCAQSTDYTDLRNLWTALKEVEVQLQPKLELPRVEGGRRTAVEASVARPQVESVNVSDKWRRGGFVEAVEQIEAFGDQFQPQLLANRYEFRDTHVERHVPVRDTKVATESAVTKHA